MSTVIRLLRVGVVISISAVVVQAKIGRSAPPAEHTFQDSATTVKDMPTSLSEVKNIPTSGSAQDHSALSEASIDPQGTRSALGMVS